MLLINSWNVAGALVSLNGITVYLNRPYCDLNAVFYSSPSFIRMRWYLFLKSIAVNILALESLSRNSDMFGNGYQFLIVMLLSAR